MHCARYVVNSLRLLQTFQNYALGWFIYLHDMHVPTLHKMLIKLLGEGKELQALVLLFICIGFFYLINSFFWFLK